LFIITPYAFEPTSTLPDFSFCDIGQVPSRPYGRVAQLPGRVPRRSRPSARSAPRPDARAGALLFRPRSCARHPIQSNVPHRLPDTGHCRGGGGSSPELDGATRRRRWRVAGRPVSEGAPLTPTKSLPAAGDFCRSREMRPRLLPAPPPPAAPALDAALFGVCVNHLQQTGPLQAGMPVAITPLRG